MLALCNIKNELLLKHSAMKHALRLFTFLIFFCLIGLVLKAQQKHFIYMESEGQQPFAIVLNGKVYSSSDYGYIIIPKLEDGNYNFAVSFPMNKFPDQFFACTINKRDVGYILKNDKDKWVLQNMQTKKMVTNDDVATAKDTTFGNMLSQAVSDSTLTKQNVVASPPDNNSGVTIAAAAAVATTVSVLQPGEDTAMQPQKISQTNIDTGTNMRFVDKTQTGNDTINVFIPSEQINAPVPATQNNIPDNSTTSAGNAAIVAVPAVVPSINNTAPNDTVATDTITSAPVNASTENNIRTDTTAHDVSNPFYKPEANNNPTVLGAAAVTTAAISSPDAVKQDCQSTLSDDDLNKLKRKMFTQHNDNDMIQVAIKYVQKKCITTDQVKLLGSLFTSDDGRYSLYDALYKYVYDYGKYPELASQIIDPYYKKRFASLLR
jgi:hypothetical protein